MTNLFTQFSAVVATACVVIFLSSHMTNTQTDSIHSNAKQQIKANPLLEKWTGPYGGLPPFDKVRVEDFKPALEAAMAEQLGEIDKIANAVSSPTFENTIVGMERSGQTLLRLQTLYGVWGSTMSTKEFQAVESEMEPKLAAFSDKITQNQKLFARIESVYNSPDKAKLTPEQQRLCWLYYTNFVRAGAKLDPKAKERLSAINQQLAVLFTKFQQNLLFDEMNQYLVLEEESDLAGLPPSIKDAAAAAAVSKKLEGKWVITNTRSSVEPFLKN